MKTGSVQLYVLILILVTDNNLIRRSKCTKTKFPAKVLQPDLDAISNYYQNTRKNITAYIHWPYSTILIVRLKLLKSTEYLQIEGTFYLKKLKTISNSHNGLYYKNGKFFVKTKHGDSLQEISPNHPVYYVQTDITVTKPYLSIRYFGLNDLRAEIEKNYIKNKRHFDTVLFEFPATFLARTPSQDGHFVEYTYWGKDNIATLADGNLLVLIGKKILNKKRLEDNKKAYRLVFDQRENILKIPVNSDLNSESLRHVIGVRMANTGFLAEVLESTTRLLSTDELNRGTSGSVDRFISFEDTLKKIKIVEPRYMYPGIDLSNKDRPNHVQFQIKGEVFVKSFRLSTEDSGNLCFVESEVKGATFLLGNRKLKRLYTNDDQLFMEKAN